MRDAKSYHRTKSLFKKIPRLQEGGVAHMCFSVQKSYVETVEYFSIVSCQQRFKQLFLHLRGVVGCAWQPPLLE